MHKATIRYLKTGKLKTMAFRYAEILVRAKVAEYHPESVQGESGPGMTQAVTSRPRKPKAARPKAVAAKTGPKTTAVVSES